MKPEDHAWRSLQQHASAQLRPGFAHQVLRVARGPRAETWSDLQAVGAARLRPGFAARVLRAARQIPGVPSFFSQFAFSAATAAVCLLTVAAVHVVQLRASERNLAGWQQLVDDVEDFEQYL